MAGRRRGKRSGIISFIIMIVLFAVLGVVIYYRFMNNQQKKKADKSPATEVEKLIAKDLETGYPETPKELMNLWGRYNQCIYNTELGDEEFDSMFKQLRVMYSSQLIKQNPEKEHRLRLKTEVDEFQSKKNTIVSYSTETGTSAQEKTIQGKDSAKFRISYFINNRSGYVKQFQDYILVKEEGRWKILGFKKAG